VIDEVQKYPAILNEVHRQIEKNKKRIFGLTGSSARKLKHGHANLLAGRAFTYTLSPLTSQELGRQFVLNDALRFGTLPGLFQFDNDQYKTEFLNAYARIYLKEEIYAEGFVRKLPQFASFLALIAQENGNVLSLTKLASDIGVDTKTIRSYIEILEDTLLGFLLPAYTKSIRARQKSHPKFYLFDPGVKRALTGTLQGPLLAETSEYGRAYEHFWILEIMRWCSYRRLDFRFSYFSTADVEIDLVVERPSRPTLFIEIKSTTAVKRGSLRALSQLVTGHKDRKGILLCQEPVFRQVGEVDICPQSQIFAALAV
jgi:predicted AAA+ superfamily ATPase